MPSSGRHIKIFISSTFQDMKEEREVLLKETFLELKKIAKERLVEITEIDLRTGITQKQEQSGEIVKICLDEIHRCSGSPIFFLGILGNRYGWDEWSHYISKYTLEDNRYSWIKKHLDKSVTQLEILSAIEEYPTNNRSFFYLKEGENDNIKLTHLKKYLMEKSKTDETILLTQYKDIKEFRDKTICNFTKILDELFPPDKNPSELERLRTIHNIFAKSRQKIYIPHKKNEIILSEFLTSDQDRLLLYGESGYGKSALIANYFKEYKGAFVITHFIGGAGMHSNNIYHILKRIMLEIKEEFEIIDDLPSEPQKILEEFSFWLQKVERPTIIILDGYNQIADELKEKLFYYLPKKLENIKLIITSIKNTYPINNSYQISSLNKVEQKSMIVNYMKEYGKAIDESTQDKILAHKQTNNTLFLTALLNEIRLLGNFENLHNDINNYLQAKNIIDLFIKIFERFEKDYKEHLAEDVLSLIYISRDGLSEDNLIDIINQNCSEKLTRYEFSPFFLALEEHLIDNNGLYGFFHDYIQEAVKRQYLSSQMKEDKERKKIVEYFESRELDIQKVRELPYHLYHFRDRDKLYIHLLDIEIFYTLINNDKYDLLMYMRYVDERYDIAKDISHKLLDNSVEKTYVLNEMALFMYQEYAKYDIALLIYQKILKKDEKTLEDDHLGTSAIYHNLALLFDSMGAYQKAESIYLKILEKNEKNLEENPLTNTKIYNSLAVCYQHMAEYEKSESFQIKALEIDKKVLGNEHPDISNSYNNLAILYESMGEYKKAERLHIKAIEIRERIFGEKHPTSSNSYNNLAVIYQFMGMYQKAKLLFIKALEIQVRVLGEKHPFTADSYTNLGDLYMLMKAYGMAEPLLIKSLKIRKSILGENHPKTASSYNNLAILYYYREEYQKAYNYMIYAIEILEKTLQLEHPDLSSSKKSLVRIKEKLSL